MGRGTACPRLHDLRLPPDGVWTRKHGAVVDHAPGRGVEGARSAWFTGRRAPNSFALAAIPARYAMERQQWADAANLAPSACAEHPVHRGDHLFRARDRRRAFGESRMTRKRTSPKLAEIHDARTRHEGRGTGPSKWTSSAAWAEAWVLFAEGKKGRRHQGRLGGDGRRRGRHRQVGGDARPVAPARELLGFMLLEAGRPKEALVGPSTQPSRRSRTVSSGFYGAGKAAEALKQTTRAKGYYKQLVAI